MSLIRFGRGRDYQFFRREDIRMRWDLRSATQFLGGFRNNAVAMETFRREALKISGGAGSSTLSDEQVLQIIARQLVSGDLMVALPYRERQAPQLRFIEDAPAAAPPPAAKVAERPEDGPTFIGNHDGVAQAAALIAAAKAAYPFCEECAKHAADQMMRERAGAA
ncbi:MAG: hypothetical protein HYX27_05310 [Acidobacteria bacterium]|nr:hypothetical protein [Acidobacteriota bacterium]